MKLLSIPAAVLLLASVGWSSPASAQPNTISWQGHEWVPRTVSGNPGAPQRWSARNVSIDRAGRLHLRVTRDKNGRYTQAELDSARNGWGYGRYRWKVDTDVSTLPAEYVLGLFTYGRDPRYGHREIDIEAAGWGRKPITWDYTSWANGHNPVARTRASAGPSTQQIDWRPGKIIWTSWNSAGRVIATATATGADVPKPYDESIGMNLWVCGCETGWKRTPAAEVIISSFRFTPLKA
jgi:hypothetical protein